MPLNGSGTEVPAGSSVYPAVTITTISSTDFNALMADFVTVMSTAMYKDGQATPTSNIGMGGFKLTNLAAATLVSDAARASQVQNSSFTSLTTVAGTNTITGTATPTPAAYVVGQVFEGIAANTNTGATTLNISSLGAGAIQVTGAALTGGEIQQNAPFRVFVSAITPVFQLLANGQVAPFVDTNALVKGSADGTKKVRLEVDGLTTATTRVLTVLDADFSIGSATQAQQEATTSAVVSVTPSVQHFHPSAAKAFGLVSAPTTVTTAYPGSGVSVTNPVAGSFVLTHGVTFSSANYACVVTVSDAGTLLVAQVVARTTTTVTINFNTLGAVGTNPAAFMYAIYGDL